MANSKYSYVRQFEQPDTLLQNTFIVIRIDGRGFHKFSTFYNFTKPNDRRALDLMNAAAEAVMRNLYDLVFAYGDSDEYSFVFPRSTTLFERRESKLVSTIVSTFTAYYIHLWPQFFPSQPLETPNLPTFDGRAVCYPSAQNLRDYLAWRQVDCHINNLYNTTFWTLVLKGGMSGTQAEKFLKGSVSANKNEILFKRFGINYNDEEEIFKKGSVMYRDLGNDRKEAFIEGDDDDAIAIVTSCTEGPKAPTNTKGDVSSSTVTTSKPLSRTQTDKQRKRKQKATIKLEHVDIIKDEFWNKRPWILGEQ